MSEVREIEVETIDDATPPIEVEAGHHYRIVVKRPRFHHVICPSLSFAPSSPLLLPLPDNEGLHPLGALMVALDLVAGNPEHILLIVGHADTGEASDPKALSQDRADALLALIRNEPERWVEIATRSGSLADVKRYLNYLGHHRRWSCYAGEPTPEDDEAAAAGVTAFQREFNRRFAEHPEILEDGVCGVETLGAVFQVLRHELDRWVEKHELEQTPFRLHSDVPALAAGAQAAHSQYLPRRGAPEATRAIDLVLVDRRCFVERQPSVEVVYFDRFPRREEHDPPLEPGAWEFGEVVVFLPEHDPARSDLRFQLRSAAGDYDRVLDAATDRQVVEGFIELVFEDVPTDGSFTLLAHSQADTTVLYADVPYADLERFHPVNEESLLNPHFVYDKLATEAK